MAFYKVFINTLESMGHMLVATVEWEGTKEGIHRALPWACALSLVSDRSCTRSLYPFLGHKRQVGNHLTGYCRTLGHSWTLQTACSEDEFMVKNYNSCIGIAGSLCYLPETITTLLIDCTPI